MDRSEEKRRKDRHETFMLLSMITQFGFHMLVPIALCFFVGYLLDRHFGTKYIAILLFFVGAMAGFRNIYVFATRSIKSHTEQNGVEQVQNNPEVSGQVYDMPMDNEEDTHEG